MKILIPMAGIGRRFLEAGYTVPKPLIEIEGKPIIEHIVGKFLKDDEFIFGCNVDHLNNTNMENILKKIAPNSTIVSMPYEKGGPIYGLKMMEKYIPEDEEVIVNYCDFSWVWDYDDFKKQVRKSKCDGAVSCYKGFHPHLLGESRYATLDARGLWMKEIREKYSWHENKLDDWSSSGTYYFSKGKHLKKYMYEIDKRQEWKINGEFYVSQLYQLMKEDGLNIYIYQIPFMLQWGTPEDLKEYLYWSDYFCFKHNYRNDKVYSPMNVLIPMAGMGRRFVQEGYTDPKPLISVDNSPMVVKAVNELPNGDKYIFVIRDEHLNQSNIATVLKKNFNNLEILPVDYLTEGQASTALLAKDLINNDVPLLIGACDNGMLFNSDLFNNLISDKSNVDALIFTFRNNPTVVRNPKMYGWVKVNNNLRALSVSVKIPISKNPINDHAVVGAFWFRIGKDFVLSAEEMIKANDRINNEFYIDNCMNYLINQGLNVSVFEVDKYICFGTPNDLRTYEYWSKYFSLNKEKVIG